jgi:hypothetical protein
MVRFVVTHFTVLLLRSPFFGLLLKIGNVAKQEKKAKQDREREREKERERDVAKLHVQMPLLHSLFVWE